MNVEAHRLSPEVVVPARTSQPVDDATRLRRANGVRYAKASLAMEGIFLDEQAEEIFARYVSGDIERDELWRCLHKE